MNYYESSLKIELDDNVILDFDIQGVVVCDFESWSCLDGYEDWLVKDELVGGGHLATGVMVKTEEYGLLHCTENTTIQPL